MIGLCCHSLASPSQSLRKGPLAQEVTIIDRKKKILAEACANPDLQSMMDCMPDEKSKIWSLKHIENSVLTMDEKGCGVHLIHLLPPK